MLVAYRFTLNDRGNRGSLMKIIIPKGTPVCVILDNGYSPFEKEILLNIDSRFVCVKNTYKETIVFTTPHDETYDDDETLDYNPEHEILEDGQMKITAIINMIDFVLLPK